MDKKRGIIFDMDNTLLKSNINFQAMKRETAGFLKRNGILSESFAIEEHTTSTLMEYAKKNGISEELYESAMQIAMKYELIGMEGAGLETGAQELLKALANEYVLVIVTNNSFQAARRALQLTGIGGYFDLIVGREQMQAMKPSPSGYLAAKRHFPHIQQAGWISVGDSWIDGRASMDAGIAFISYGRAAAMMEEKGIHTVAHINNLMQLLDIIHVERA